MRRPAVAPLILLLLVGAVQGPRSDAQPAPAPRPSPASPAPSSPAGAPPAPSESNAEAAAGNESGFLDRWLYNARERTRTGRRALAAGDLATAVDALDRAAELRDSPEARYNAATGRLLAGRENAAPLLDEVAEQGPDDLAARSAYNLGHSRLGDGDLEGALDAFRRSLLKDPTFDDARWNLELTRRLLEQQQQQQQQQEPSDGSEQEDGDESQDQENDQGSEGEPQEDGDRQEREPGDSQDSESDEAQGQEPQDGEPQDEQEGEQSSEDQGQGEQEGEQRDTPSPSEGQEPDGEEGTPPGGAGAGGQEEGPLPQFQDLPDMSAEEAAAILEAVENLEREQRRQAALEAAARAGKSKKDW